jgi:putative membrane protein PagO
LISLSNYWSIIVQEPIVRCPLQRPETMAFQSESTSQGSQGASRASGGSGGSMPKRRRLFVVLSYLSCCLIWGTTWYAIRIAVEPGVGYPPNFASAIRFALAVILYIPLWFVFARQIHRPTLSEVGWMFVAGILNGFYQCFMYTCECTLSGGLTAVILSTSPLMVAAMVMATKFEKVRWHTLGCFALCFAGVSMVCLDRAQTAAAQLWGIGLALVAALFSSVTNITLKGRGTSMHVVVSATIFLAATDIPVWVGSFLCGEKAVLWPVPFLPALAVIYMSAMSSVVALSLYLYLMKHMSLMGISTMQFVLPVLALVVDMALERRVTLTPIAWTGIAIVLSGVLLSLRPAAGARSSRSP